MNGTIESCGEQTPKSSNDIFLKVVATQISALIHSKEPVLVSNLACAVILLLFSQYHVDCARDFQIKITKEIKSVLPKMQGQIEAGQYWNGCAGGN